MKQEQEHDEDEEENCQNMGEQELFYLGIKEHLAFLDYTNYFINTGQFSTLA